MEKPKRKGAARIAEIEPEVLERLNRGEEETVTLVEWLAVDQRKLLNNVVGQVGLEKHRQFLDAAIAAVAHKGVSVRQKAIASAIFDVTWCEGEAFEKLATHNSDLVRAWAALAVGANVVLPFADRLRVMRRFAADSAMGTRECAWDSWRPHFVRDIEGSIPLLEPWVRDEDPNIRRCAVEGTRPRGVWTAHVPLLKEKPELALPLLDPVKSDPSRYVQNAVANWLNDASRTQRNWVMSLCKRWSKESQTPETEYIVKRALRTARKSAIVTAVHT